MVYLLEMLWSRWGLCHSPVPSIIIFNLVLCLFFFFEYLRNVSRSEVAHRGALVVSAWGEHIARAHLQLRASFVERTQWRGSSFPLWRSTSFLSWGCQVHHARTRKCTRRTAQPGLDLTRKLRIARVRSVHGLDIARNRARRERRELGEEGEGLNRVCGGHEFLR